MRGLSHESCDNKNSRKQKREEQSSIESMAMTACLGGLSSLSLAKSSIHSAKAKSLVSVQHSNNNTARPLFVGNAKSGERRGMALKCSPGAALAETTAPAIQEEEEEVVPEYIVEQDGESLSAAIHAERKAIREMIKERLPGGFAAQEFIGTGYRKTAIARVVLLPGNGNIYINNRTAQDYLQGNPLWLQYLKIPLVCVGQEGTYDIFVKAQGGGLSAQAQACSLGIARALCKANFEENRPPLRKKGLLTRDIRIVERKKAGLKKARKAPQYSKR